jgi:hypothetical protein
VKDIPSVLSAYEAKGRDLIQRRCAPATTLQDLSDAFQSLLPTSVKELQELSKFFERQMLLCRDSGAYFLGCLAGAAMIESCLLLFCVLEKSAVERTRCFCGSRKNNQSYEETINRWTLKDLIPVAEELQWVGPTVVEQELVQALVDGYREMLPEARPDLSAEDLGAILRSLKDRPDLALLFLIQSMRNLMHGGRCLRLKKQLWSKDFDEWSKLLMILAAEIRDCLILRLEAAFRVYLTDLVSTPEGARSVVDVAGKFMKKSKL